MKKQFKFLSVLFLATAIISCEGDDEAEIDTEEVGAYSYLVNRNISIFDTNETLNIDLFSSNGVQVESVEIVSAEGSQLATATVAGETATFSTSTLGDLEAILNSEDEGSIPVRIESQLSNGKMLSDPATITVYDAIELDEDNPTNVMFLDNTSSELKYSTFTYAATIDNVSLFWKKNADGTYADTGESLDTDEGEIDLANIDYDAYDLAINDTLYYKFIAESGTMSQSVETAIAILPQIFGSSNTAVLSSDPSMNTYNLGDGEYTDADGNTEIEFMDPSGFETTSGIDFVKVTIPQGMTASEYFAETNLFNAEMEYNDGTKLTSEDEVSIGDVYIYKVIRENEDEENITYFGIIRIGDTTVTNGVVTTFEFEYAEGTILRE